MSKETRRISMICLAMAALGLFAPSGAQALHDATNKCSDSQPYFGHLLDFGEDLRNYYRQVNGWNPLGPDTGIIVDQFQHAAGLFHFIDTKTVNGETRYYFEVWGLLGDLCRILEAVPDPPEVSCVTMTPDEVLAWLDQILVNLPDVPTPPSCISP